MQSTSGTLMNVNRRRFSDEQIRSLELMFEAESTPEWQIKQQLADELGLQPRQVSIWFQNRRARWKTKQVEREYNKLKASHDALFSSFESLKRENQSLLIQRQKLTNILIKQHERKSCGLDQTGSSRDQRIKNRGVNSESKEKLGQQLASDRRNEEFLSSNQISRNTESTREETEVLDLTESTDASMTSLGWHNFESDYFLQSSCSSEWCEFLP